MAYILTQEDIDRFGLIDAMAGDVATAADLQKMGLGTLPKQEVLENYAVDPEIKDIADQSVSIVNQPVPVNNQPPVNQNIVQQNATAGNKQLLDLLALTQQPQVPVDPFENLSKNQRRMLAFAGIKDAGLALQGKEGSSVSNLMKQFTERADIERKRKAAAAQSQMLTNLMTMSGSQTPVSGDQIAALKSRRDMLMQVALMQPSLAPSLKLQIDEINRQVESIEQKRISDITTATGAGTVLNTVSDLMKTISENPTMTTGPVGMVLGMMPFTKAGEARLTTQTLKANLAFDALRGIKASGATLGSVSAPELALLEAKVANLDLNRSPEAIMSSLQEIDRYYKQLVINAYQISDDPSQLDAIFGGRPEWASGPTATLPEYTFENVPLGELVVDREGGNKVYKFLGGDRNNRSNWQEVNF
jgi:hypothetical protein